MYKNIITINLSLSTVKKISCHTALEVLWVNYLKMTHNDIQPLSTTKGEIILVDNHVLHMECTWC